MTPDSLRGAVITLNGDRWTVVDVAPAEPLAEMVAVILEDEGIVSVVRGTDPIDDVYSHLGGTRVGTTVVLVPEADAERALAIIAATVTDYEGEELEAMLAEGVDPATLGIDTDPVDGERGAENDDPGTKDGSEPGGGRD